MQCCAMRSGKKWRSKMKMALSGRSRALLTGNLEPWQWCFDVDNGAWSLWGNVRGGWWARVGQATMAGNASITFLPTLFDTTKIHPSGSHKTPSVYYNDS